MPFASQLVTRNEPIAADRAIAVRLVLLFGVLFVCDLYRQRFHIRPRREVGVYWRAAVLKFAKWPWLAAAFFDALRPFRGGFEITEKRARSDRRGVLVPHAVAAAVLLGAWVIGALLADHRFGLVDAAAAVAITASAAVALSGRRRFPPPYDPALLVSSRWRLEPGSGRRQEARFDESTPLPETVPPGSPSTR